MKILVVEDDRNTAEMIKNSLTACSHTVDVSFDGADGSFLARSYDYDAVILDYAMPKKDGLAVCREMRAAGKTAPIIFLSVTGDPEMKVAALKQGADDYMTKPFSLDELRARLDALARRSPEIKSSALAVADLALDPDLNAVRRGKRQIHLTRKEFHMLQYLMQHSGTVMSRAQLMEHVWTADGNPFSNTVEAHIRNLRKKLNAGKAPNLIANVPGRGYVIDTPKRLATI
jgi:two-component system, OmpR family, response regulator